MIVVSLFDGIGVARWSLNGLNAGVQQYFSSEIDKFALQINNSHFQNDGVYKPVGDVKQLSLKYLPHQPDLLIFGSPCTNLSIGQTTGGKQRGLVGESALFFEALRIRDLVQPRFTLMENVKSMSKSCKTEITKRLGLPVYDINSNCFVPQNRKRLYWTDCPVDLTQVPDKGTVPHFSTILECQATIDKKYFLSQKAIDFMNADFCGTSRWLKHGNWTGESHSHTVVANYKKRIPYTALRGGKKSKRPATINDLFRPRNIIPEEAERLQGLPNGITAGVSDTQRYKCIGNSFTLPVITFLLKGIV